MSISGGLQLRLGPFFSKDDTPAWAGAHDLSMASQFFQGGLQLVVGRLSKDDIHIWAGAHGLKMPCQFQGGVKLFLGP